jgi:hypothetical protein
VEQDRLRREREEQERARKEAEQKAKEQAGAAGTLLSSIHNRPPCRDMD